ncbi:SIP domain-containing protein [Microbacterium resistens]|uniref:SIP domain-containing protein n=1 Tax=Microbacterium resistens TaxID=156977 RepID=A0ABY3RZF4_9MICO|nr:SIP domain-containing protein [Microbacterium resistens]UGS27997.1 SIP domain-containing protein [Microbacterium resistens]
MAVPCAPARVVTVTRLTPHMIRVSLEPLGGWRWHTDGIGDERIDIALPRPGETVADIAVFNLPEYGSGWQGEEPPWRHYTVRAVHDGGRRFDIDFVVHGHGVASSWAERAAPGHVLGVFNDLPSRSYYDPPEDAVEQILVADATGLPGLGRIVEGLAPGTRAIAIAEVPDEADVQEYATDGDVEFRWLIGSGNGRGPSSLPLAVAELTAPASPWYAWVACEASASRAIRGDLRVRLGSPRDRHHAIGYWTMDKAGDAPAEVD